MCSLMRNSIHAAFSWLFGIFTCVLILLLQRTTDPNFGSPSSSALVYYVLNVYISPPVGTLSDVAVYPPRTIEEEEERLRSLGIEVSIESVVVTPSDEKKESDFL